MADPGKDKNRKKIKREHRKLRSGPQQNDNQKKKIPLLLLAQTRPNKNEMEIKNTHTHTKKLTPCAKEWPIPVKTRKEKR